MNKKVAVVDIDGTLWSLAHPWHDELKKVNPDVPFPGVGGWDFWKGYIEVDDLVRCCNAVHYRQYEFEPFSYASRMVKSLRDAGYYVIIASHRDAGSLGATVRWLSEKNIPFDDVQIGSHIEGKWDKASLFDEYDVDIFIDDAPKELAIAVDKGIKCFTIEYEYNNHFDRGEVAYAINDEELCNKVELWLEWKKQNG